MGRAVGDPRELISAAPMIVEFDADMVIRAPRHGSDGGHSDLMPANLTTFAHFSVSAAISCVKPAGDSGITVAPSAVRRALIRGSERPALISRLSLSTISTGVLLGASKPRNPHDTSPGTESPTVGPKCKTTQR